MDIEVVKLGFQIGQFILMGCLSFYVYMSGKNTVTNDRISKMEDALDSRLDDHATRIARLEERAALAPTHDDLGELHEKTNGISGKLDNVIGQFGQVKALLGVIHEYILNGAKK